MHEKSKELFLIFFYKNGAVDDVSNRKNNSRNGPDYPREAPLAADKAPQKVNCSYRKPVNCANTGVCLVFHFSLFREFTYFKKPMHAAAAHRAYYVEHNGKADNGERCRNTDANGKAV